MDKNIKVLSREDLIALGWTFEDINLEVKRLDGEEVPNFIYPDDIVLARIRSSKMKWYFLYDEIKESIIGYWGLAPVTHEFYQLMCSGENKESDFTVNSLLEFSGKCNIAISGFVLQEDYQSKHYPFKMMITSLIQVLTQLVLEGLIIQSFISRAFTEDGEKLCEGMGMAPICKHPVKGIVFQLNFTQPKKVPILIEPRYNLIKEKN
jgi:hypothetical protein